MRAAYSVNNAIIATTGTKYVWSDASCWPNSRIATRPISRFYLTKRFPIERIIFGLRYDVNGASACREARRELDPRASDRRVTRTAKDVKDHGRKGGRAPSSGGGKSLGGGGVAQLRNNKAE